MKRVLLFLGRHAVPVALTLVAVVIAVDARLQAAEMQAAPAPEPEPTPTAVEQYQEVKEEVKEQVEEKAEDAQLTAEDITTILEEADRIEAALLEQGYFREDIPLTYLEQDYLHTAADEFGIDYYIMVALVDKETDFKNTVGDDGNAFGYGQVWPKWWSGLMEEIGAEDLMDPRDNFRTACAIVASLTADYGDIENALTYYNTGHPGESEYASDILANAEKWREA